MRGLGYLQSAHIVVLAGALCSAALGWEQAAAQERTPWVVITSEGHVAQQSADGSESPVEAGATLAEERSVKIGADGRLILAHGNDRVTVSPNSAFFIPRDADPTTGPSLLQTLGTLLFKVEHTPGRRFEIQAPYLAAVVKGTVFTVTASDTGNSVHVAEGAVEVAASVSHNVALIHPGQTALVSSSGRTISVVGGKPETKSENHQPGADGQKAAETTTTASAMSSGNDGAAQITQTLGDMHLDISSLTQGLVTSADNSVTGASATTTATGSGGTATAPRSVTAAPAAPALVETVASPAVGANAYMGNSPVTLAAGALSPSNLAARKH